MLPHQRSWRCQPSASLPSAPPTGSCSWGSVPQWLHLSLQITFKKLSLDSMPQAEMAGYPSKLQLGDKDPPHPWPLQSPSRFRHPGLEQPNAYLLLVRVRQEAAAFLQGSQDLLLCAVFLQVAVQIAHQPLAHLTEATVLQRCHTRCVRKRAQAQRRPGPLSPRGGAGGVRGAGLPHHRAHQSTRAAPGWSRDGACCTPTQGSPPAGGATGWSCRTCRPTPGTPRTWTWATWSTLCPEHE